MNTYIIRMKVDYVVFRLLNLTKAFSRTCLDLSILLQVIPIKVNDNYFTPCKGSRLNPKII